MVRPELGKWPQVCWGPWEALVAWQHGQGAAQLSAAQRGDSMRGTA